MSKTTASSSKTSRTTTTTAIATGTTPNTEPTNAIPQNARSHAELDNISRYRESPSWTEPYYVHERMNDREGHRARIKDVIKGIEGVLGLDSGR
ncbi:uncharacterized protein BDW43DRAFT_201826 [Aspergillus alliaceus]|uniref:uncharacterized protein n=1 Tax=Petromyces alliaceus TaxID=209559 RepID=UPI0012A6C8CA|nr:uncharacterized protein BDW43DRAFT_201826 [Aspergillus alliaceus]KAB8237161.1 hypothetical protein BDW43DRAFT_201826 [Aspergillus alliaceus]